MKSFLSHPLVLIIVGIALLITGLKILDSKPSKDMPCPYEAGECPMPHCSNNQAAAEADYKNGDYQLNVYMDTLWLMDNNRQVAKFYFGDIPKLDSIISADNQ